MKKKIDDFFGLWCATMNACKKPDEDPFGELCKKIFESEYAEGEESRAWLNGELAKISDAKLREKVSDAAGDLLEKSRYFYLAAGFALGQDYEPSSPKARTQIQYLRQRIREAGIFPLMARSAQPTKV